MSSAITAKLGSATAKVLADLKAAGVSIEANGDKIKMRPAPSAELLDLVKRHKAEILAELTRPAPRRRAKAELPELICWKMSGGGVYRDGFVYVGRGSEGGQLKTGETYYPTVLVHMPRRVDRFTIPYGAIAWQAGDDIRCNVWRSMSELPKSWR